MIPILYEKDETEFTSNGLGRLRDCITCTVTEERNGIYECDLEYPVGAQNADKIQVGRVIAVEHDDTGDVQPFDIMSCTREIEGIITIHCVHISYRQSYMTVTGKNINSLADAFTLLESAVPTNPFSYWTDKTSTNYLPAADGIPKTVRSMLGGMEGSILDTYGGEYEFDKFHVNLHNRRGKDTDFIIRYGVNMTGYEDETDISNCYSSCVPYWTDGTDTIIGDKQTLDIQTPTGRDECTPLDVSDKFEEKPTKAQVNTMGMQIMSSQNPTRPSQNITVSFVSLQDTEEYRKFDSLLKCSLCDTIRVIFPDFNSSGSFKIVRAVWDVLKETYEEMELGELSVSLSEALGLGGDTGQAGGSAVASDYDELTNKPQINSVELSGNKTLAELGIVTGSQTADCTSSFTIGKIAIVTGNTVLNVNTANSNVDKNVSFGITFKHLPSVQVSMRNIGGNYYQKVTAAGISETGFAPRVRAGGTPGNVNVNWIAVGELA